MPSELIQNYLDDIITTYHYLDFRGVLQIEKIVELELDEIFTPLKAAPVENNREDAGILKSPQK